MHGNAMNFGATESGPAVLRDARMTRRADVGDENEGTAVPRHNESTSAVVPGVPAVRGGDGKRRIKKQHRR